MQQAYAIMCAHNRKHAKKSHRINEFGKREIDDFLLCFKRETVHRGNLKYPLHTFNFHDLQINITYVKLLINYYRYKYTILKFKRQKRE